MIDSHQHYWQLHRFNYGWIKPDDAVLRRNYMPPDVWPQMQAADIERGVFVQAASTPDEIAWMLQLSDEYPYIAGVVGWLDMSAPGTSARIGEFARDPRFKGVRISTPYDVAKQSVLKTNLAALGAHGLSCDLLIGRDGLTQATALITAHPEVTFILDHLAGVRITASGEKDFKTSLAPVAAMPNVTMKLSGYLTLSQGVPREELAQVLAPYVAVTLETFGTNRLMFGSDWPVCTLGGTYADAVNILRTVTTSLSTNEQHDIWGGTAARVYRL